MANMLCLPTELLEQIFHYLDSIDDVHNLGRVCTATHHVIRRLPVYTRIMRSVIGASVQHRLDISLCRMLDLHRLIVQHFADGHGPLPATQPHSGSTYQPFEDDLVLAVTSECPCGPCIECLPDVRIHEILARYQGIRVLEDVWLATEQTDSHLIPADFETDVDIFGVRYTSVLEREEECRDGDMVTRLSAQSESYTSFNVDQRNRFYAAITSVWLLNEIRWVLAQFEYPSASFVLQVKLLTACKQWVAKQSATPLLDDLDRNAVFRFLYHYVLPIYGRFLADRCDSTLPLTFSSNIGQDPPLHTRNLQLFLTAGQVYLQPPDFIDLIIRSRTSRKRPYPHLPIPQSTSYHQHPSPLSRFPPTPPPTARIAEINNHQRNLRRRKLDLLNIIARASINQNDRHLQSHQVVQPDPKALYKIVDDSAAYFEKKALSAWRASLSTEQLNAWRVEWGETWWTVWWWANSEEKARAKLDRWKAASSQAE